MPDFEVPPEAVEAVLSHRWGGNLEWEAHTSHNYSRDCAVCTADVERILAVAAPAIAAAALRSAAETLRDCMAGEPPLALAYHAWLRMRADQLDGRQPKPDTREGILAATGLTEGEAATCRAAGVSAALHKEAGRIMREVYGDGR